MKPALSRPPEPHHREGMFAPRRDPEAARIRTAIIDLALERGLPGLRPEEISARAGLPLSAFSDRFADPVACALAVYRANIAEFDRHVFVTVDRYREWPLRLRIAAYATARYVRLRPRETAFDVIEMLRAGELAQAYRDRYVRRIVDLIDEGREVAPDPTAIRPAAAEAALGSIYGFLSREMSRGRGTASAEDLVPELMYIAVRPYFGPDAAAAELTIPPPEFADTAPEL